MSTVRTRFAPSPTGSLHVGGARTALYCMLFAQQHGGRFVLRIEDTDRTRSTEEAALGIVRDLRWLGLHWDEGPDSDDGQYGPYLQSRRLDLYNRYIDQLLSEGRAYLAWETREELEVARREAEADKSAFRYHQRVYSDSDLQRFRAEGREPVVRLCRPGYPITVSDRILGEVTVPAADLDDIVIRKADGFPTYHFAVVVDDYLMEITQVLRGQEHLMNTAKHIGIYDALGWSFPEYGHLPLIFNPAGSKMSKRDKARAARDEARTERESRKRQGLPATDWGWLAEATDLSLDDITAFMKKKNDRVGVATRIARALSVELPLIEVMDFRRAGYLPEALLNYLALLGWSPGDDREVMTLDEMRRDFDLSRVNKTAARFDFDKVRWMNGEYMRHSPIERLQEALTLYLEVVDSPLGSVDAPRRRRLLELYRARVSTFAELDDAALFFFERPVAWEEKACKKHLLKGGGLDRLRTLRTVIAGMGRWSAGAIEETLGRYCEERELSLGKVAQPLRVAVSGGAVSPPIFDTLGMLERAEVLARIDACVRYVDAWRA